MQFENDVQKTTFKKRKTKQINTMETQKNTKLTERKIQSDVFQWFYNTYPHLRGLFYMNYNNPPNARSGSLLIGAGLVKGIPDVFLAVPNLGFHGLYIEFKTKTGKLSDEQKKIHLKLIEQGFIVYIGRDVEQTKEYISNYLKNELI